MAKSEKDFYITTSIAYTNAPPHIGFALEVVQADVLARFNRQLGKNVFFLTGTDEHGTKIARAAEKAGKAPKNFVDEIALRFALLKKILNLSNDYFIRTSNQKQHWPSVGRLWLEMEKRGDIYKKKYRGFYCVGCEAFITEKDLIEGRCDVHQKKPEILEEENYFFRLSGYQKEIGEALKKERIRIVPESRKNEMLIFLERGLEDVSFSRPRKNLSWGIPVPSDEGQTVYVWADALANYLSALNYGAKEKRKSDKIKTFWPPDIQCIGKDILRFHSLIWPGMLLALNLELPKIIFVHGFISVAGQKMSKSLGNVIDPFALVDKYGTDAVRYFLLREISPTEDSDFTYEKFEERYNSDLASGLGNLVSRVITMAEKEKIHEKSSLIKNPILKKAIEKIKKDYFENLNNFRFNDTLNAVWNLIRFCDRLIDKERPWEESKKQKEQIRDLLLAIGEIALLLNPFLPQTSGKIGKQLKTRKKEILFPKLNF